MIKGDSILFSYEYAGSKRLSLDRVSINVERGQFAVILGRNGSGKSTLVKHFNGLLELQGGELTVSGIDVGNESDVWRLRRKVGMVFQNPDNQFVSSIVEEDVAFGLENYGVPRSEIHEKVTDALRSVGMEEYAKRSPHTLSGGQKQRVTLAGVLALNPELLVFDEVTAMLDPEGRKEILSAVEKLHNAGKTVVMITHYIEEAVNADIIYIMDGGKVLASGTPGEILTDPALLSRAGLMPPMSVRMYRDLKAAGIELPHCPLTNTELAEELCRLH